MKLSIKIKINEIRELKPIVEYILKPIVEYIKNLENNSPELNTEIEIELGE